MKNKNLYLILAGVSVAILLAAVLWFTLSDAAGQANVTYLSQEDLTRWEASGMNDPELSRLAKSLFDAEGLGLATMLEDARFGRVLLPSELWRLRRRCPDDMELDDCNLLILQYLKDAAPAPDNLKLVALFKTYMLYEQSMLSIKYPSDMNPDEQYRRIREQRRESFSNEDAELVFGYEETRHDFGEAFEQFVEATKDQPGDKRVQAYEELREKHWGRYYAVMKELEPSFDRYTVEMDLRAQDLTALAPGDRDGVIRGLREKHFGRDGAERMAAVDREIAAEETQEQAYRNAETELLRGQPNLSAADRDRRLAELRLRIFGSQEAADAFFRREQLRLAGQ